MNERDLCCGEDCHNTKENPYEEGCQAAREEIAQEQEDFFEGLRRQEEQAGFNG